MKDTLRTEELAERWNINPGTLRNWRMQGKGPKYLKFGKNGLVLYRVSDIIEYEKKQLVKAS